MIEHGTVADRSYDNRHLLLGAVVPERDLRAAADETADDEAAA